MKKVLAVVAVVCVVFVAGAAIAQPRGNNAGRMPQFGELGCRRHEPVFTPDMTDEIRAKVVEAEKLRIDLEAELAVKKIDKEKALALFSQLQKAEQEIEVWKFNRKLEMIDKHHEMMEEYTSHEERARRMLRTPEAPKD